MRSRIDISEAGELRERKARSVPLTSSIINAGRDADASPAVSGKAVIGFAHVVTRGIGIGIGRGRLKGARGQGERAEMSRGEKASREEWSRGSGVWRR